jgi:hypothetical protein
MAYLKPHLAYSDRYRDQYGKVLPNLILVELKKCIVHLQILEPKDFFGFDKPPRTLNLDVFAYMHYTVSVILAEQLNFTLVLIATNYAALHKNDVFLCFKIEFDFFS